MDVHKIADACSATAMFRATAGCAEIGDGCIDWPDAAGNSTEIA